MVSEQYKTPTKEQIRIISKLLSIDRDLVPVVIPTRLEALPLLKLFRKVTQYKDIERHVSQHGLDEEWLKSKLGSKITVNSGRWKRLIDYLSLLVVID